MEIVTAVAAGIISGILSSVIFWVFTNSIRPKLKIAENICLVPCANGRSVYCIKFVNHSRTMLINVNYVLQYVELSNDNVHSIEELPPCKEKLKVIDKHDRNDKDSKYAVRISYDIPNDKMPTDDNTRLRFTVFAEHPLSGATTCVTREYKSADIISGIFQTGDSLKFLTVK